MAKKTKYPAMIYVGWESDSNDKSARWLVAQESIPSDGPNWNGFGVYRLIGSGRAREVTESKVKLNKRK